MPITRLAKILMTGALALLSLAAPPSSVEQPSTPPEEVRTRLGLDPFYTRYHEAMAEPILAELADRPLAFLRHPEGVAGEGFFQRHAATTTGFPPP
mgnify:CR=1 FL=1